MCKPGKSFNAGVKTSYFSYMKVPCKNQPCRRGSAPYGQSDSTSRPRAGPSGTVLNDSLEHGLNISETPRSCTLQRAPVRWTLTLETNHLWSLGPCQCRNTTEQRLQRRAFPVTSCGSIHISRVSTREHPKEHEPTTWHPKRRTELTRENEAKASRLLQQQTASITNKAFLSWLNW